MPIDFSSAWDTGVKITNKTISLLPNLVLAILIFLVFLISLLATVLHAEAARAASLSDSEAKRSCAARASETDEEIGGERE